MKSAFLLLCLSAVSAQVAQFIQGVVEGCLEEQFPIAGCAAVDSAADFDNIGNAIQDFEKWDEAGVKQGLQAIGNDVYNVAQNLASCGIQDLEQEMIEKLERLALELVTPESFALTGGIDLILNGVDIYHDVKSGVDAWNNWNYIGAGQGFGQAMSLLLLGENLYDSDSDLFLQQ